MTPRRVYFVFGLAAALLIIAVLGPIDPFHRGWGGDTDDFYEHVNLLAWQAREAAAGRPFPLFSRDIAYPDGGCMFLPDPIGGTAMIPFAWVFGHVFAHNLLVFLDLWLAAMMIFAIVRRRTGDDYAAALAGAAYAVCPVMLGNVNNGIDEVLQAAWLPWVVDRALALCESDCESPGPGGLAKRAALLAASLAFCALGQWYYGIYGYLAAGAVVTAGIAGRGPWRRRALLAVAGLAAAALGAALVAFPAFLFTRCFRGGGSLFYLGSMDFYIQRSHLLAAHGADPAYLFAARPAFDNYLHLGYAGFVLPVLLGLAISRRPRLAGGLAALAALFAVLALGPLLSWRGEILETAHGAVRLPYYFLYRGLPFFKEMRLPYRFFLAFSACASLALGLGLAGLGAGRRGRGALFLAFAAALVAEVAWNSGAPVPMTSQDLSCAPASKFLAGEKGAVLDLPMLFGPAGRGHYLLQQACHARPLLYGVQGKDFAPSMDGNLLINLFHEASGAARAAHHETVDLFRGTAFTGARQALDELADSRVGDEYLRGRLNEDTARLAEAGVTDVIYHRDIDAPDSRLPAVLRATLGEPIYAAGNTEIFSVSAIAH